MERKNCGTCRYFLGFDLNHCPYSEKCFNASHWASKNTNQYSRISNPRVVVITEIKDVIFNDPATIVFWSDGTKTVVKCQEGDDFDPEKGLAMAISKKALGNKSNFNNEIKKWTEPYYEKQLENIIHEPSVGGRLVNAICDAFNEADNHFENMKRAMSEINRHDKD